MFCRTAGSRTGRPDGPPVVVFEQHEGIPSVHRPAPPTRSRQAPNDEAPTSGPTPDTRSVQFFPAILCNLKSAMTVGPHQPMWVEVLSSVVSIERPRWRVMWIHVNADAPCLAGPKPSRQGVEQCGCHACSPPCWDDIEPLNFTVATEAPREMSGDEPKDDIVC